MGMRMRRHLAQLAHVFETNDEDESMDAVVRRFWSRTKAASGGQIERNSGGSVVVDLARWSKTHGQCAT